MKDKHHKALTLSVMAIGALMGVMAYLENKRNATLKQQVLLLDKGIKELQIEHMRSVVPTA